MSLQAGLNPAILFFYQATAENITDYLYRKFGPEAQIQGGMSTAGSSTTVTGATLTNGTPVFAPSTAGDVITFSNNAALGNPNYYTRKIVSVAAGNASIVVSSAVDLPDTAANTANYYKRYQGTADTDGWVDIPYDVNRTVFINITTYVNPIDVVIQGRVNQGWANQPITLYSNIFASSADTQEAIPIGEDISAIRVGVRSATIATDPDSFSIYMNTRNVR